MGSNEVKVGLWGQSLKLKLITIIITENLDTDITSIIMFGIILFFYCSVELWNKLPNKLVSCKKIEHFRLRLKKFDFVKYNVSKIYK